jgi:hypothetical protein
MYRITGLDGAQYIAQDINVLQQWVNEGRITPQMIVEDMTIARSSPASSIPGLSWPYQQPAAGIDPRNVPRTPFGQPTLYPRGVGNSVPSPMTKSVLAAVVSFFGCCIPIGVVAIIYAAQVDSCNKNGDINGAMVAAKNAHNWANVSIGISVVFIAIKVLTGSWGLFSGF